MKEPDKKKLERIVVGVNSLVSTVHAAYSNHMHLWFHLGRCFPQYEFIFVNPPRMSIDRMRNLTAQVALQTEAKYLIFLDDDVLAPIDFLEKLEATLEERSYDILCGNVLIRGYPFENMFFKWTEDERNLETFKELPPERHFEVIACGFSLCLIRVELFKQISTPYFVTSHNGTEDIMFCMKARRELDNKVLIGCDQTIKCGHILWNEIISADNLDNYKKYYEQQFPWELKKEEDDRSDQYLSEVNQALEKESIDEAKLGMWES